MPSSVTSYSLKKLLTSHLRSHASEDIKEKIGREGARTIPGR
jgi:hypothetical protein